MNERTYKCPKCGNEIDNDSDSGSGTGSENESESESEGFSVSDASAPPPTRPASAPRLTQKRKNDLISDGASDLNKKSAPSLAVRFMDYSAEKYSSAFL